MRFKKDCVIKVKRSYYRCLVCDGGLACFGKLTDKGDHLSTSFEDTFIVSNSARDNFKYEHIADHINDLIRNTVA